jgi:cell wall-associated NlpC family hydrolase
VALPQVTTDQVNAGTRIGLGEIRVGELSFYGTGARRT